MYARILSCLLATAVGLFAQLGPATAASPQMLPLDGAGFATSEAIVAAVGIPHYDFSCGKSTGTWPVPYVADVALPKRGISEPGVASALVRNAMSLLWIACSLDDPRIGSTDSKNLVGFVTLQINVSQPSEDMADTESVLTVSDFDFLSGRWGSVFGSWQPFVPLPQGPSPSAPPTEPVPSASPPPAAVAVQPQPVSEAPPSPPQVVAPKSDSTPEQDADAAKLVNLILWFVIFAVPFGALLWIIDGLGRLADRFYLLRPLPIEREVRRALRHGTDFDGPELARLLGRPPSYDPEEARQRISRSSGLAAQLRRFAARDRSAAEQHESEEELSDAFVEYARAVAAREAREDIEDD